MQASDEKNASRKILWGICGIGLGHTFRQLPLIEALSEKHKIVILAYGESLRFYQERYDESENVTVLPVAVPFYIGSATGLNFAATASLPANRALDLHLNFNTLSWVEDILGVPDLVISDYEPISAQYAYAKGAPLVTLDQQSKYLLGQFPDELNGLTYVDEVARLNFFFPHVSERIAVSFFGIDSGNKLLSRQASEVRLFPPVIKESVQALKAGREYRQPGERTSLLLYLSSQQDFVQPLQELINECAMVEEADFHLFLPRGSLATEKLEPTANTTLYETGDSRFLEILAKSDGIVTTAGHSLLSEAMYLGLPCYTVPLPVYEQAMNAHVIHENGFGVSNSAVRAPLLRNFLANLAYYAGNIARDEQVLLRGSGRESLLRHLEETYLGGGTQD